MYFAKKVLMITHTVFFSFKSTVNEPGRRSFFDGVNELKKIPGVKNLQIVKQTSAKNKFEYGITMDFDNEAIYNAYNIHPSHTAFINNYWLSNIDAFLEIDYQPVHHSIDE